MMVDNYEVHTPVVDRASCTIVEYCGYCDDKKGTGKNCTQSFLLSSTSRAYITATSEDLCSYLLGGRDGIYNNENRTLTTKLTSTNTNDNVADRTDRTVRDV